uniref:Cardenolide 16-O-glucohydrolase n=1 Tax=Digitalis lanata TaxID=49450 RepID=Q9ZPB6_DIGLA|nr:cardenolide 16-O-glucohydrolase [Digitalis lanata]
MTNESNHTDHNVTRASFNFSNGEKFVFGSATSAYQIEGCAMEFGKGLSVWDTWTLDKPGHIIDGTNGNVAANQYHLFKEDMKIMKRAGLEAYRFSISWPRILPGGKLSTGVNKEGIKYYNDLIDAIIAEGMQPYVTLFHWDLPLALELEYGGFLDKDKRIVEHFRDYAELCFWEFGDRVKHWITINEAWSYTVEGYVNGTCPPGRGASAPSDDMALQTAEILRNRTLSTILDAIGSQAIAELKDIEKLIYTLIPNNIKDLISKFHIEEFVKNIIPEVLKQKCPQLVDFIVDILQSFHVDYKRTGMARACSNGDPGTEPYIVAHNIILAHAAAVRLYKTKFQAYQGGKIGMTNNVTYYLPYDEKYHEDVEASKRGVDFMLYWFVEPIVTGKYPERMVKRVGKRLPCFTVEEEEMVRGSYDFLGVNYYTTYYAINLPIPPIAPPNYFSDMGVLSTPTRGGVPIGIQCGQGGWIYIYPRGLYLILIEMTNKFKDKNDQGPLIYITENGASENANTTFTVCEARYDPIRVLYHNDHLWYLKKAMEDGVNLKGYFIWSFADNFEWNAGYTSRFGIFYVDFVNGQYTRYPKSSALWWTNFLHDVQELKVPDTSNVTNKRSRNTEEENATAKKPKNTSVNSLGFLDNLD